jgi:hypothetical protein
MSELKVIVGGQAFYKFDVEYRHEGHTYTFEIWATDHADAERRLRSIKGNAEVAGQIVEVITCGKKLYWPARLYMAARCWFHNAFRLRPIP